MGTKMTVQATYEDGVFKPLPPLLLEDKQRVELQIVVLTEPRNIVKLGGILAPYCEGEAPTLEEINALVHGERQKSFERLLRQLDGDFTAKMTGCQPDTSPVYVVYTHTPLKAL